MRWRSLAVCSALVAITSTGCGGGGTTTTRTSAASTASGTALPAGVPAALRGVHGHLLVAGELPGFAPQGQPRYSASPEAFVSEAPPGQGAAEAARLRAHGFVASLSEHLAPTSGGMAEALSLVEYFRSAHGAAAEVDSQVAQATQHGEKTFAVAGIPAARGFGSSSDANVLFSVGPYYYLVGFGAASATTPGLPTRAQVTAAAASLYRRVHA